MEGGADDEVTLRRNTAGFDRWAFLPRPLTDVSAIDTRTTILGHTIDWPVMLAPTGLSRLFHPDGERAVARAAAASGSVYCLSTMASTSIEDVAKASAGPKWFQVYCFRDRELTREFLTRAKAAGYTGLCVTVDVQVHGNRERDRRSGMTIPPRLTLASLGRFAGRPGWVLDYLRSDTPILANVAHKIAEGSKETTTLPGYVSRQFDPTLTWKDIGWMVSEWGGPLLVKGILHPDDVREAIAVGVRGIIVSNHGGRQLDGAVATIDALPRIADAAAGGIEIILDGGIRRGTHVLKALALGARACMIGRPYLYGLAAGGEAGVRRALTVLREEVTRSMALAGVRSVGEIARGLVTVAP